ncbi:hypothetical protein Hanom_Chr11g01045091 [Helianthus anomalus]
MITYHETKKKTKVLHNSICLKIPPLSSVGTFRDQLAGDKTSLLSRFLALTHLPPGHFIHVKVTI